MNDVLAMPWEQLWADWKQVETAEVKSRDLPPPLLSQMTFSGQWLKGDLPQTNG